MVLIFGVVAHALDLMVPEAIRKKLEPMLIGPCNKVSGAQVCMRSLNCSWVVCKECWRRETDKRSVISNEFGLSPSASVVAGS